MAADVAYVYKGVIGGAEGGGVLRCMCGCDRVLDEGRPMDMCHGVAQSVYGHHPAGDVIDNVFAGCHDDNHKCGADDQLEWTAKRNRKMAGRKVWMGVKALHGMWKDKTFKKKAGGGWMTTDKGQMVLRDEVAALYG